MEKEELEAILEGFKTSIIDTIDQKIDANSQTKGDNTKGSGGGDNDANVEKILELLQKQNDDSASKMYDTLFDKEINTLIEKAPAFGDYLASTDDYGDVIKEKISNISDYNQRLSTLSKVFKTFATATAGGDDPSMQMSKEMKKKVEKHQQETDAITDKWNKGELSREEFTEQFFGTIQTQLEDIQ